MGEEKREFRGVWFPAEIWLDERLTALEKMILIEIDSLDGEDGCYASNEYLAKFCQCSQTKVSSAISKLKKMGFLTVASFDGRRRVLHSCLEVSVRQTNKNCKSDSQNLKEIVLDESPRKEKEERRDTYDGIIREFFQEPDLIDAVTEFIKMRKLMRAPMTNRALRLMLRKLCTLGSDKETRIAILNRSIENSWKGVYPLKDGEARGRGIVDSLREYDI